MNWRGLAGRGGINKGVSEREVGTRVEGGGEGRRGTRELKDRNKGVREGREKRRRQGREK